MIKTVFSGERSFARDFTKTCFVIVFLATVATNVIAYSLKDEQPVIQTVAADAKANDGVRTYSEVRSVLDDDIVTGTSRSQLNRVRIDPCKAP